MKKNILILLFLTTIFTSCEKEELTPEPTFSDVTWYSNPNLDLNAPTVTLANKTISIFDLSQGALTHEWTISSGSSFLVPGFPIVGGNPPFPDLSAYIDTSLGLSTTNKTVYIYYPTAGNYTITLKNTFKDKVTYNGTTPIESVLIDGVWVFEQTFNVTVN